MHFAQTTTRVTTPSMTMTNSNICAIVAGGSYSPIDSSKYNYIIACDHGYNHCAASGVVPHIVMGDMDSIVGSIDSSIQTVTFSSDKDDTDTMIAVKHAIDLGYNHIHLLCATGGRIDHMLANIATVVYAVTHGVQCYMIDECNIITATTSSIVVDKKDNYSLTLLSYSDSCIVSVSGTSYTLDHHKLTSNVPLGVSNEIVGSANITVYSGVLLVIQSKL